jgi:antitoxin component of MazEF toxin-antitoxin module
VRIPKSIAAQARLSHGSTVELSLAKGKLIIKPLEEKPLKLKELLREVTDKNLHSEWDTGLAVGMEAW